PHAPCWRPIDFWHSAGHLHVRTRARQGRARSPRCRHAHWLVGPGRSSHPTCSGWPGLVWRDLASSERFPRWAALLIRAPPLVGIQGDLAGFGVLAGCVALGAGAAWVGYRLRSESGETPPMQVTAAA